MSIAFPNVPFASGVPTIARSPHVNYIAQSYLGVAESYLINLLFPSPKWGLYDAVGDKLFDVDNVIDISYKRENRVSNFPVQGGTFASYNKVKLPYLSTLRMSKGGSITDRSLVLSGLEAACNSTKTYTIITPEISYIKANIISFDYKRTSNLLIVDVQVQEIREVNPAYSKVSNTLDVAGQDKVSNGISQPTGATSTESSSFKVNTITSNSYLSSAYTNTSSWIKSFF